MLNQSIVLNKRLKGDKSYTSLMFHDKWEPEAGGISNRPDNAVDVFHMFFGVAGT